ncbi:hypothetical protein LCGC14_1803990 [marine sediment metagenome]|uniref:DNA (cytosine-5-)-methyltransferase n=1 Tax=marine sediment metagenome TaxID=412755 RepID=A0A0F9GNW3_9ZZZZ
MRYGDLFAGGGGLSLGLERAGMECAWQVEVDPYATKVLEDNRPDVRRWGDVRTFPPMVSTIMGPVWQRSEWAVDLICGGFPCIDISDNGKKTGLGGKHSSLWFEMLRVIRLVRPRYIIVENVAGLLVRGLDRVLGTLAESGYDAEWDVLPACAFGAPQPRERVFVVAYSRVRGRSIERELRILGQIRGLTDSLAAGEHRASHAARVVRRMDANATSRLDRRNQR